jgi:hypothetical protein
MDCPSCSQENPATNRFCGGCGAALARACRACARARIFPTTGSVAPAVPLWSTRAGAQGGHHRLRRPDRTGECAMLVARATSPLFSGLLVGQWPRKYRLSRARRGRAGQPAAGTGESWSSAAYSRLAQPHVVGAAGERSIGKRWYDQKLWIVEPVTPAAYLPA